MTDPALGLLMLALIVVVIMMGFATAFTLMGLGMFFGFIAFYDPSQSWTHNKVFELMVQRTYGAMTNDVLISIPLFVLMGYVMERGALVDKMFYSIQLAFRRVPAALAATASAMLDSSCASSASSASSRGGCALACRPNSNIPAEPQRRPKAASAARNNRIRFMPPSLPAAASVRQSWSACRASSAQASEVHPVAFYRQVS